MTEKTRSINIFKYENYKDYIRDSIGNAPNKGRGMRKKLSDSIGCQIAYTSHVLNGDSDFNLEQAEACARFFQLDNYEKEYFLTLVSYNRSGTKNLHSFFATKLKELRSQTSSLQKHTAIKDGLSQEDQLIYYSSWSYAAIHMLVTIKEFQTLDKISQRLNMSEEEALSILNQLIAMGLIEKNSSQRYLTTQKQIYLNRDSLCIPMMHTQWRTKAIEKVYQKDPEQIHYSLVFTCSKKDKDLVMETIKENVSRISQIVSPSIEEELMTLNIDCFSL